MSHSIGWAKQSFNGIGNLGWEDDYEPHIIFGSTLEQVIPYTYEIELNVRCHVMIRFIGYLSCLQNDITLTMLTTKI